MISRPLCFQMCALGDGPEYLGSIETGQCARILSFCPYQDEVQCLKCRDNFTCSSNEEQQQRACRVDMSARLHLLGTNLTSNCSAITPPVDKSSRVLANTYWLCGSNIYTVLLVDWDGLCTLVRLQDSTFILTVTNMSTIHKQMQEKGGLGPGQ